MLKHLHGLLHLPQFRQGSTTELTEKGEFDFEVFSPYGMPSYIAVFARDTNFKIDSGTQPLVTRLSIMCSTTQKKSNSIQDASIGQLYHLTQRNVHPAAEYDRVAYDRRQTILLSAEDVGLMGLKAHEYQKAKRINYVFTGTTDRPGQLYVIFVYNNRGLHIDGRRLQLVTLHE